MIDSSDAEKRLRPATQAGFFFVLSPPMVMFAAHQFEIPPDLYRRKEGPAAQPRGPVHDTRDARERLLPVVPSKEDLLHRPCTGGIGRLRHPGQSGHGLENLVFTALRRQTPRIHYYRTCHRKEVDFIALRESRSPLLVQVCESLCAPQTRKRELAALEEAMEELGLAYGLGVTRSEAESLEVGAGTIEVLPAWRFLLPPESATLS